MGAREILFSSFREPNETHRVLLPCLPAKTTRCFTASSIFLRISYRFLSRDAFACKTSNLRNLHTRRTVYTAIFYFFLSVIINGIIIIIPCAAFSAAYGIASGSVYYIYGVDSERGSSTLPHIDLNTQRAFLCQVSLPMCACVCMCV